MGLLIAAGVLLMAPQTQAGAPSRPVPVRAENLGLLPYPQQAELQPGTLPLGPPRFVRHAPPSPTERVAQDSLSSFLPRTGTPIPVRLGSLEEGCGSSWLTTGQYAFLSAPATSPEASVLTIAPRGITVIGKNRFGMLYGVQTVNQLARQATRTGSGDLPCLAIRDWPDLKWRCLSPALTWYSGWNRLEGYDLNNYTEDEWKWLVDWSLLHKLNAWSVCLCGYWPFTLPGYEESTLDVDSFWFSPATGKKEPRRFIHRNIQHEFFPRVIRYAQERGIHVYAYMAHNSFDGGYMLHHPEADAGGAAEMLPFAPGVHEYIDAFLGRLAGMGFDGFMLENPEANHVPNQNEGCYRTFWEPWAKTYGYTSRDQTDSNRAPLGVHIEYYTWLFREFYDAIKRHWPKRTEPEIYLVSHFVLLRVINESRTPEERARWLAMIDEGQGRQVPFVVNEADERKYVDLVGGGRIASLGGRGGACLSAWRRMTGVNNNMFPDSMGASVDWERDCKRRIHGAGGFGAMAYVLEWRSNEIFGYVGSQYMWRASGVPGINNDDQIGFLDYAYRAHYGEQVGPLVAQALDTSPCVNDAMVLEDVHGAQYPETGRALHREYQLLAAQADQAVRLAWRAYRLWTGHEPDLERPAYRQDDFRWRGHDRVADHLFKAESLRWLCVELRRAQLLCRAALCHRLAARRAAEGASVGTVLGLLDRAVHAAEENQRLYQTNFDDDYHWNEGLCVQLAERLRQARLPCLLSGASPPVVRSWSFAETGDLQGWTAVHDLTPPAVAEGALTVRATGDDPFIVCTQPISLPASPQHVVEIEMASDQSGWAEFFWWTTDEPGPSNHAVRFEVTAGERSTTYDLRPNWTRTIGGLRLDTPDQATVRLRSIRILELPTSEPPLTPQQLARPVSEGAGLRLGKPLFLPWEKLTDRVPPSAEATEPGIYLSVHLGLSALHDKFCHGVVFTVQDQGGESGGRMLFRRTLGKNSRSWEHWDIPIRVAGHPLRLRFVTDSYTRAQNRDSLSWEWALWGQPELVRIGPDRARDVIYRFADHVQEAHPFVRMDSDGLDRPFDAPGRDSTGATFRRVEPGPLAALRAGEGKEWQWIEGFAGALSGGHGPYRSYLGSVESWWCRQDVSLRVHPEETGEVTWLTAPVPTRRETAVAFIAGTDYASGAAQLEGDGQQLIGFEIGNRADARWREGDVELRYYHGGDTRDARTTFGLSGVFVLRLPPGLVMPGQPLRLTVRMLSGGFAWFMVHGYRNVLELGEEGILPKPAMPAIAAFTPHDGGAYGVTGADYEVEVPERG